MYKSQVKKNGINFVKLLSKILILIACHATYFQGPSHQQLPSKRAQSSTSSTKTEIHHPFVSFFLLFYSIIVISLGYFWVLEISINNSHFELLKVAPLGKIIFVRKIVQFFRSSIIEEGFWICLIQLCSLCDFFQFSINFASSYV